MSESPYLLSPNANALERRRNTIADAITTRSLALNDIASMPSRQKQMIKDTWKLLSRNRESLAVDIFVMIFEQSPESKELFFFSKKDCMDRISKTDEFKVHAMRFIQTLDYTVAHLDDLKTLDPVISNLGVIHSKLRESRGFNPYVWQHLNLIQLRDDLNYLSIGDESDLDLAVIVWRAVLQSIVNRMQKAYDEKVQRRASMQPYPSNSNVNLPEEIKVTRTPSPTNMEEK